MDQPITELLPFTRLFLAVLLHFVWQATLIVALVAIGRSLLHPKFFRARYLLSVMGLLAVLMCPLVTAGYYLSNQEAMLSLQPPVIATEALPAAMSQTASFTSLLETQFQFVFNWFDNHRLFWLGCWLIGFVVLLIRLCLSLGHCYRLRRRQNPLPPHLQELANTLKKKLNLTRRVIVASSQEITQAVATGIIKPVVLIPAAWVTQLPAASIEAVLAHELAHLKRWDLWINLLQRFAETVFFFHPLVWWLSQQISSEREVCCDQLAIQVTGQPMEYVETLAQVAGTTTFNDFEIQFGTAFIGGKNMNLLRRAKMILEPSAIDAQSPFRTLALIACTGLMISYGSYAYCATPLVAAPTPQDHDHDHDHDDDNDHEHDHADHDQDRDHRVIVGRRNLKQDSEGRLIEFVLTDDESEHGDDHAKLHGHLVKLLHGQESGNVNKQELARQLRQLADRLEAEGRKAKPDQKIRRRVQVQRRSEHSGEHEFKIREIDSKNRVIVVDVDPVKNTFLHKQGEPKKMIFEVKKDEHGDILHGDLEHKIRSKLHDKEHAPAQEYSFHVDINDGDKPHEAHDKKAIIDLLVPHEREVQFGHATTSDGELGQVLRDLRSEVQQLRREVNQLRSDRNAPTDRPARVRVQERKIQPHQRIELKRLGEYEKLEEVRVVPGTKRKSNQDSNKKSDGVWIESKSTPGNVWFQKKPDSKNIWIADVKTDEVQIETKSDWRKTQGDDDARIEVEVELDDAADQPRKTGLRWVVEHEDVEKEPKAKTRLRLPKAAKKKTDADSETETIEVEIEESAAGGGDESEPKSKSKKNKKKK